MLEKNHGAVEASGHRGAGGLLLLAAANVSGLIAGLETAIASCGWPSSVTFVVRFQARRPKKTPMKRRACPLGGRRTGKRSRALAEPTTAKLIPIVTTAPHFDAVELAQTYIRRWPGPRECHP